MADSRRLHSILACLLAFLMVSGAALPSPQTWQCRHAARVVSASFTAKPTAMPCRMGGGPMSGTMACCRAQRTARYSEAVATAGCQAAWLPPHARSIRRAVSGPPQRSVRRKPHRQLVFALASCLRTRVAPDSVQSQLHRSNIRRQTLSFFPTPFPPPARALPPPFDPSTCLSLCHDSAAFPSERFITISRFVVFCRRDDGGTARGPKPGRRRDACRGNMSGMAGCRPPLT